MKELVRKYGMTWSLYGALLTTIAFSALALASKPAYAAECGDCNLLAWLAWVECNDGGHGDITYFDCGFRQYEFACEDGYQEVVPCCC